MNEKIKKQIIRVADTGLTNMFDLQNVKTIAECMGLNELIKFVETHKKEYTHFILNGDD